MRLVLDQLPTPAGRLARGPHAAAVRATRPGCDNLADGHLADGHLADGHLADGHLAATYLALTNAHDAFDGTAT